MQTILNKIHDQISNHTSVFLWKYFLVCEYKTPFSVKYHAEEKTTVSKMWSVSSLLNVSASIPHPLAIRYQIIFDAAFGAPVFCQLILCYLLQVEHCHLGWPTPHSATRSPFQVIPGVFTLCHSVWLPVLSFFLVIASQFFFFLCRLVEWHCLMVVLFFRLVLLLLAHWR